MRFLNWVFVVQIHAKPTPLGRTGGAFRRTHTKRIQCYVRHLPYSQPHSSPCRLWIRCFPWYFFFWVVGESSFVPKTAPVNLGYQLWSGLAHPCLRNIMDCTFHQQHEYQGNVLAFIFIAGATAGRHQGANPFLSMESLNCMFTVHSNVEGEYQIVPPGRTVSLTLLATRTQKWYQGFPNLPRLSCL